MAAKRPRCMCTGSYVNIRTAKSAASNMSVYLINEYIYIYMKMTQLQLGKLNENCSLLKLYRKLRKIFLSLRRESNPQSSDLR